MKELTIEMLANCSWNCVQCSAYDEKRFWEEYLMMPRDFISALDEFNDCDKVRLSGGEPFMHPALVWFLRQIKKRGKATEILTSGSYWEKPLPEKTVGRCRGLADNLAFSLHDVGRDYNMICRMPFGFWILDKSIDTVMSKKISFSFTMAAMKSNKNHLERIVQYAVSKSKHQDYCKPKLVVFRYIKQGSGKDRPDLALDQKELDGLAREGKLLSEKYHFPVVFGCSITGDKCIAGSGKAVISAYGERTICSALKYGAPQIKFGCRAHVASA